jgi:hypothetical protein
MQEEQKTRASHKRSSSCELVNKFKELPEDIKASLEQTKDINDGLSCFRQTAKHKLEPKNTSKTTKKIPDHACGFCNVLCRANEHGEVAPSSCLDVAVLKDNGKREMFKKNQKQVLMQSVMSKLGQKKM